MGEETQVGTDTSVDASVGTNVVDSSTEGNGELEKYKTLAENYKIRAEKAEAKLKPHQKDSNGSTTEHINKESKDTQSQPSTSDVVELAKLYAKGLDDGQVAQLTKIAGLEGITREEALNSELYTTWNTLRENKIKEEKAQLGASKGSRVSVKKTLSSPGLSPEEHKALYREKFG